MHLLDPHHNLVCQFIGAGYSRKLFYGKMQYALWVICFHPSHRLFFSAQNHSTVQSVFLLVIRCFFGPYFEDLVNCTPRCKQRQRSGWEGPFGVEIQVCRAPQLVRVHMGYTVSTFVHRYKIWLFINHTIKLYQCYIQYSAHHNVILI